jgi:hypothetical protein
MAAATFALIFASPNRLLYLVTTDGSGNAGTLTSTGAGSPDLVSDSQTGPLQKCALAFYNGFGNLPAGALVQANARAIWLSDLSSAVAAVTLPTARVRITPRTGLTAYSVDANVDGSGHPTIVVTPSGISGTAILDILVPGAIGE